MATPPPKPPNNRRLVLLRRADQAAVAALTLSALVSMAIWWVAHGGHRGGLIEIDRADPLEARFQIDVNTAPWRDLTR